MSANSSLICLEFNELTPWLMDKFISEGKLPHFQRLREQSHVYTSDAEASGEWLNPWVQWVTIHSGLAAEEHGVFRLSNAYKLDFPAIWDLLSDAGRRVWVCGSMNPWYHAPLNGYVLPDAWSQQVSPYPQGEFERFYTFVQKNVQEYAASKVPVSKGDLFRFLSYLAGHGLRLKTAFQVAAQLMKERTGNHHWRRAAVLDALQYDIFEWYYRKHRPQFSTFFVNSTAHYQHKFWRNMQPEAFQIQPNEADQRDYKDAILFGYQQMDHIVGRVLKLAPQATIMLMTGLGQQPYTKMEETGGKRVYRMHGESILTEKLGIEGTFRYEPIMADQFILRFEQETEAQKAAERLSAFRLPSGKEAFTAEVTGGELIGQCRCRDLVKKDDFVTLPEAGVTIPFQDVFYRVDAVKSGFHHPEGIWWIRQPERVHTVTTQPVPLIDVAPTILDVMGVSQPEFMKGTSRVSHSRTAQPAGISLQPVS